MRMDFGSGSRASQARDDARPAWNRVGSLTGETTATESALSWPGKARSKKRRGDDRHAQTESNGQETVAFRGFPPFLREDTQNHDAEEAADTLCSHVGCESPRRAHRRWWLTQGAREFVLVAVAVAELVSERRQRQTHFRGILNGRQHLFFERRRTTVPEERCAVRAIEDRRDVARASTSPHADRDACAVGEPTDRIVACRESARARSRRPPTRSA